MAQSTLDLILRTRKTGAGEREAESGLTRLSGAFQSLTGFSLGGAAALGALAGALRFSINEAAEAQRVDAQLNAVLQSTGGAAGLTAEQIEEMATGLSRLSGFEDEAIKQAAALMLTFTKVGRQAFPDAMEAALNMSAALGQDLQSSVIQLGKALNDPIQGVTALRRVGVSFNEDQRELIKTMVEAGDVMGAQRLILQELETEFGGAAEAIGTTFTGELNKTKNELGNIGEAVGTELLPSLTGLLKTVSSGAQVWQALHQAQRDGRMSALEVNVAFAEMVWTGKTAQDVLQDLEAGQGSLAETTDGAAEAMGGAEGAAADYSAAMEDAEEDTEALKQEQERLKGVLDGLHTIMDGPVSDEYEEFADKQGELQGRINNLIQEIDSLEDKKYLTGEQKTRLGDLRAELESTQTEMSELAVAHEDAMARIMFGMAEEALARDGWTADEIEALTKLGAEWGLLDQATATAMGDVARAVEDFNESGSVDRFIDDMGEAKRVAEDLAGEYNIDIVTRWREVGGPPPINQPPGGKRGRQFGGPIWEGWWEVGEAGPEAIWLAPGSRGFVAPGNTFNLYANYPYQSPGSLADDVRMLTMLYGGG